MKIKIYILILLVLPYGEVFNQTTKDNSVNKIKYFELEVEIIGLGRDYVGCGSVKYTICVKSVIKSVSVLGEEVLLYITCPEILNGLPYGDNYKIGVEFYRENSNDGIVHSCDEKENEGEIKNIKLKVLDIKVRDW
ncbi:MAG: hypothetical protein COA31_002350 [Flavobacteriales bacterium]|nr:hypothetical protein [Flavobacteriales bacterium]